jgi:hypothetical protein
MPTVFGEGNLIACHLHQFCASDQNVDLFRGTYFWPGDSTDSTTRYLAVRSRKVDIPSTKFIVGQREFNPDAVGIKQFDDLDEGVSKGFYLFDTTKAGSSNAGHEFGALLSNEEREQILEFLRLL